MKKIIFILLTVVARANTVYAQCPARAYTPEWDWRQDTYTFITRAQDNNPVTITKKSPWWDVANDNLNTIRFRDQNPKDYEPIDGWMLIQRNFGTTSNPVDNPYFILYNQYSGILRIFVCIVKQYNGYTSAAITLRHYKPGILTANLENHTANAYRSALDDFDNEVPEITVPNYYVNGTPHWLHADFSMNYDPCTCNNPSKLVFAARLISTANLSFQLNGTAVERLDEAGRSSDGKQSLTKSVQSTVDAGNSFFKSAESGISTFNNIFPNFSKRSDVKALEAVLPGLSAAVGVADFVSGLFGASAPQQPMSFDINLKASGTLTINDTYKTVILDTPGSANLTAVPPTTLNYNNVMGVFNLLETPSVILSNAFLHIAPYRPTGRMYCRYKLNSNISYIINPMPQFDLAQSEIKFALVFEHLSTFWNIKDPYNHLIDEGRINGKHVVRTKYISANCSSDLAALFDYEAFFFNADRVAFPNVYLKVIAALKKDNKTTVYVSKYKVNVTRDDSKLNEANYWPASLLFLQDDITYTFRDIEASVGVAWNSILFDGPPWIDNPSPRDKLAIALNNLTYHVPQSTYTAGNSITVTGRAIVQANTVLRVGTPNGCASAITQGNPAAICNSTTNAYYRKSHAFARGYSKAASNNHLNVKEDEKPAFALYPNPASYKTTLSYYLEEDSPVSLSILNANGQIIAAPIHDFQTRGQHEFTFDATFIPAGLYFIHFVSNSLNQREKLVIIK